MPETRVERALFVLGVLGIAALGFLVAHLWHHTHGAAAPGTAPLPTLSQARTTGTRRPAQNATSTTTSASTTGAQTTTPATTATTAASGTVFLLLKAKTDTWLEVRAGSSTGSVLYSGTLASGTTKIFRARSLWARFGAAGNLSARFNKQVLHLPSGTYDATFDGRGFRRAA